MVTYTTNYLIPKPSVNDPVDEDLWGGELNDGMDIIDAAIFAATSASGTNVPTASVFPYAGATAPSGYLLCFGQAVSRTTYSALFAIISTTYGSGDGSTTFNLPDLRGRVVAGKDDMGGSSANRLTGLSGGVDGDILGAAGGSQSHVLTTGELATHSHTASIGSGSGSGSFSINTANNSSSTLDPSVLTLSNTATTSNIFLQRGVNNVSQLTSITVAIASVSGTITVNNTGSNDAHNNVQPTIILNYIIKT